MSGESGNPFGDMVRDVATRERVKGGTLDTFGELVTIEERIDRLLHVLPPLDWTPPQDAMVNLSITMERLNNLQARYRAALVDVQQWARREAQHIRDDVEMAG